MCDEDQQDMDSAAEAYQQQLESAQWAERMRSIELDALKAWWGWSEQADARLATYQRAARARAKQDRLSGTDRELARSVGGPSGEIITDSGTAGAGTNTVGSSPKTLLVP